MKHAFRVGERYRNRKGDYEVVELEGSRMTIRYSDGQTIETTIEQQARIWQNIQTEARREKPILVQQLHEPRRRYMGMEFRGLQEHDFKEGVGGTCWRARKSLGGLLAQRMSDIGPYTFESYVVYRRPEVHIARPEYYHTDTKWQEAKFVFYLNSRSATYGFYVEKNNGPMDGAWHWLSFLGALKNNEALQGEIQAAMCQQQLYWGIYVPDDGGLIAKVWAEQSGLKWEGKGKEQEDSDISWTQFVERLSTLETNKWCDLYLYAQMDKEIALAAGVRLAEQVADVYQALLPLYEASIGYSF